MITLEQEARLPALREAWAFSQATLVRLRAIPAPSLLVLRSIRQETATLMQLDLMLSKAEARMAPAVDPAPSKWAGVLG